MNITHQTRICALLIAFGGTQILEASIRDYIPFAAKKEERETMQKEYALKPHSMVSIKNITGNISIKTAKQNKAVLVATKRAKTSEQLQEVSLQEKLTQDGLYLSSQQADGALGTIDIELTIPETVQITASTDVGSIAISGTAKGKLSLTAANGDITVQQAENTLLAHTTQQGSITIDTALGNVMLTTDRGNITIEKSYASVIAQSQTSGSIRLNAQAVPATGKLQLNAQVGSIQLGLSPEANATLHGSTKRGMVTCQLPITLKPRTTTLDRKAWKQFKEQCEGTLGSGEATIMLCTNKGNVRINEFKA